MAEFQIVVGDDGKITGELPDAVKAHLEALKTAAAKEASDKAFNEGFAKGNAKKADELKEHLIDPAERQRLKTLEQENEKLKIADLERDKKYEEANKIREERHAKDLKDKDEAISKREGKLRAGVKSEIKAAALKYGARDESLDELASILAGEVDFDDQLEPFVKGSDGKAAVDAKNQPLTIEGRVRAYLDSHRHHVKGPGGTGGGAPGGAGIAHLSDAAQAAQAKVDAAQKVYDANPRNNDALIALHNALQELAKAQKKE